MDSFTFIIVSFKSGLPETSNFRVKGRRIFPHACKALVHPIATVARSTKVLKDSDEIPAALHCSVSSENERISYLRLPVYLFAH